MSGPRGSFDRRPACVHTVSPQAVGQLECSLAAQAIRQLRQVWHGAPGSAVSVSSPNDWLERTRSACSSAL